MSLVIGAVLVAVFVLGLRLGARLVATGGLSERWDELVFLVIAPALTSCLAFGIAFIVKHVASASPGAGEALPVAATIAVMVAAVVGWRRIRIPKPVAPVTPITGSGPAARVTGTQRKAA